MRTKVMGLDPGSQKLGYGILQGENGRWARLDSGTIRLNARDPLPSRLVVVYEAVSRLLQEHAPDLVAVEECFVAHSPRAALVLGQVRGVLLLAIAQAGIASCEFAPRSVKRAAVGNGAAAKEQVQYMIPRLLSGCPAKLGPDEADALAIAWCAALHRPAQPPRVVGRVPASSPAAHPAP